MEHFFSMMYPKYDKKYNKLIPLVSHVKEWGREENSRESSFRSRRDPEGAPSASTSLSDLRSAGGSRESSSTNSIHYPIISRAEHFTNIILDMDHTLIEGYFSTKEQKIKIEERPHLKTFFQFIFHRFERVSIWTNGNKEWYDCVYDLIFYKYIPKDKYFDFVYTFDDGLVGNKNNGAKDLNIIFEYYAFDEYNRHNTFLLDDSKTHYNKNPRNCFLIKPFKVNLVDYSHQKDTELLKVIQLFS